MKNVIDAVKSIIVARKGKIAAKRLVKFISDDRKVMSPERYILDIATNNVAESLACVGGLVFGVKPTMAVSIARARKLIATSNTGDKTNLVYSLADC